MKEITRFKLYLYPLLILIAGLCLTFYISYLLESDFQHRRRAEFDYQARLQTEALQQKLDRNLAALETLRVYQITRNKIRPEGFKRFVNQLMRNPAEVKGIFWIPRLSSDKLQALPRSRLPPEKESQIQTTSVPDSPTAGDKTSAIVYAIGGHRGDSSVLKWRGTDIYGHPLFREPLSRITQTRWPVSTDIFPLGEATRNSGVFFLQLVPVRSILPTSGPETIRSRGSYIGLLLDVNRLVRKTLTKFNRRDVNLFLFDQTNQLITSRGRNLNLPAENRTLTALKKRLGNDLFFHSNLQLYNKRWPVVASPGTDFWLSSYHRGSWVALASGLVITLLATGLLFSLLKWTRQNELQATVDHLTGLFNRRKFFCELDEEIERARRYSHPLGLLLLDLDNFKRINDTHGHPAGDRVLENLGQIIEENTRETDLCARYGGEEFAILLPETDSHETQQPDRVRGEFFAD